ncbi:MAG: EAL domain-containing protein [Azoarcus sp.]|nr:EAL domain-containing protein [Azoarcus sp.]
MRSSLNELAASLSLLDREGTLLRTLVDAIPDLVFFKDEHGRYLGCNRAFEKYAGLTEADLLGRTDAELFNASTAEAYVVRDRRVFETGEPQRNEEWIVYRDGRRALLDTLKTPFTDAAGRRGLIGISRDITALKRADAALRSSQESLERAQAVARTGSWVLDLVDNVLEWSAETYRIFDVAPETPVSYAVFINAVHPEDRIRVDGAWRAALSGATYDLQHRVVVEGCVRWVHERAEFRHDESGRLIAGLGTVQDITEQKQAEERLKQAAAVFENTAEGVLITDVDQRIVAINSAFSSITGYTEEDAIGQTPCMLIAEAQGDDFHASLWREVGASGHRQGEVWSRRKNGEVFPELLTLSVVRDAEGFITNFVGVFSDISRMKQTEARLQHLAHYDALTDLPNRVLLNLRLEHGIERVRRSGKMLAVLFIDIDRFKNVNDSLGHPVGDELLIKIADRLRARMRGEDTLSRLGGDEFVILLDCVERLEDVASLAQEVIVKLNQAFRLASGQEIFVGASIGISLYPNDTDDHLQLIRNADAALYEAKAAGRNVYRFYTEALTLAAHERLELESALRRALEREELVLHYQPVVSVASGHTIGVEALVRWNRPGEGLVSPVRFIPVAEDTGLIVPLGAWVMETACRQGRAWVDAGRLLSVAVNISSRQFSDGMLVETVRGVLERTGFPASMLTLELTESAIMSKPDQAIELLTRLKETGVKLSIDDFGTGYSSLAYLKRFPVDTLKIDRSFVADIADDENDRMIVATVVAMARQMRLNVIAEGVETAEQFEFLSRLGCAACQGYLFGRPVVAADLDLD